MYIDNNFVLFIPVTDCSRVCPPGCTISTTLCGVCEGSTSITDTVTDCDSGNPLGSVEVFAGNNLLDPLTETDVTGSFQLTNMCVTDLELYFYKYGYTSEREFYTYSSPTTKMCANCKYICLSNYQSIADKRHYIF